MSLEESAPPARLLRTMAVAAALLYASVAGAAPAGALTMGVSPQQGPPGTTVTLSLSDMEAPCEVRFDDAVVISRAACQPQNGAASPSFVVPPGAVVGNHQVSVTVQAESSSSQVSNSFKVTSPAAPRPPAAVPRSPLPPVKHPAAPPRSPAALPAASPSPARSSPGRTASPFPTPAVSAPVAPSAAPALPAGTDPCAIGPALIRQFTVVPTKGPAGMQIQALVSWSSPTACPGVSAQLIVNRQAVGDAITIGGPSLTVPIIIAKDAGAGPQDIKLVRRGGDGAVLAAAAYEVLQNQSGSRASGLTRAAVAAAAVAGLSALVLWKRRAGRGAAGR